MIIDFGTIAEKRLPQFKGGEGEYIARMYESKLGKIMYGKLEAGSSIGMHTHETSSEIIYILSGKAEFIYDGERESVSAGGCHFCPKGHSHSLRNGGTEDLIFFAAVPEQ